MGRGKRRHLAPFEIEIEALGPRGVGIGHTPDGAVMKVRCAAPGSRVFVRPAGRRKGIWNGRRQHLVRPPADAVTPDCPVFGLCGGCSLQELSHAGQQRAKEAMSHAEVANGWCQAIPDDVRLHEVRGATASYGYRNKVELSFGGSRYLSEDDHAKGLAIDGNFMGFHASGRFDRVVDVVRCSLMAPAANAVLSVVRSQTLVDGGFACWNSRDHTGFWRHLVLRTGTQTGELLAMLYTASPEPFDGAEAAVHALAESIMATELPDGGRVVGVIWGINDGLADVARGETRKLWGQDWFTEKLGDKEFRVLPTSFFQTNTLGAEVLYDVIGEAIGGRASMLMDLYCGTGSIGLYLSDKADRIVGIEEVASSIQDARANAARNGVQASYFTAKVEDALEEIESGDGVVLVVDPPRVGLHPKVAKKLAKTRADVLVYVACNPASLGRDAALMADGWKMTDLWTVDLFPQTGHVEAVARFERI
ncbi:MAG: 23S rRNA (uracil(1939)-C(5))-methyltransferase RlmD [Rhodobacterales bacterium]|nr:23S rRNA (uracil(1939)-C(5))-methyltransferase RlmD [Rhodobacterales bacterium]